VEDQSLEFDPSLSSDPKKPPPADPKKPGGAVISILNQAVPVKDPKKPVVPPIKGPQIDPKKPVLKKPNDAGISQIILEQDEANLQAKKKRPISSLSWSAERRLQEKEYRKKLFNQIRSIVFDSIGKMALIFAE
jgi:hypothetical protein